MKLLTKKRYKYLLILPAIFILWLIGGINIESVYQQATISKTINGDTIEYDTTARTHFYWGWSGKRLKDNNMGIGHSFIIEGLENNSTFHTFGKKKMDVTIIGFEKQGNTFTPATVKINGSIKGMCSSHGAHERLRALLQKIQRGTLFPQDS